VLKVFKYEIFNLCWVNSPQLAAKHLPSIQLNTPSACGGVVYFIPILFILFATQESQADGVCQTDETIFFFCQTSKQRFISLCGNSNKLQYHFGTTKKPELVFPENSNDGNNKFLFAHYFRYQTDNTEITFKNNNTDYAVFDYSEDGKNNYGVRVTTTDDKSYEIRCSKNIISNLYKLKSILKCDKDNALNLGQCN